MRGGGGMTGSFGVNDGPNSGAASAFGRGQAASTYGSVSGSALANVFLPSSPGGFTWALATQANLSVNSPQGFSPPGGSVNAGAAWQDVLTLSNTNSLLVGSKLRLSFIAKGSLSVSVTGGVSTGDASASAFADVYVDSGSSQASAHPVTALQFVPNGSNFSQTQSINSTFSVDIPIVPGRGYVPGIPGSFYYRVQDAVQVAQDGGIGTETATDPLSFLSITLPDVGNVTPESLGVSVTFDSGIVSPNLTPTPEPSTFILFGIGLAGMAVFGWRRRKPVAA